MTPLDWIAATDFTLPLVLIGLALVALFTVRQVKAYGQVEELPRPDQRMSAEDRRISLSDADDYFHRTGPFRLQLHELRRQREAEKETKESDMATRDCLMPPDEFLRRGMRAIRKESAREALTNLSAARRTGRGIEAGK